MGYLRLCKGFVSANPSFIFHMLTFLQTYFALRRKINPQLALENLFFICLKEAAIGENKAALNGSRPVLSVGSTGRGIIPISEVETKQVNMAYQ